MSPKYFCNVPVQAHPVSGTSVVPGNRNSETHKAWHSELPVDGMHDEFLLFNTPPNNQLGLENSKRK